jgi:hypothetical protein
MILIHFVISQTTVTNGEYSSTTSVPTTNKQFNRKSLNQKKTPPIRHRIPPTNLDPGDAAGKITNMEKT